MWATKVCLLHSMSVANAGPLIRLVGSRLFDPATLTSILESESELREKGE